MNLTGQASYISNASWELFWIIVGFFICSALTCIFRKKLWIFLRTLKIKVLSDDFQYSLLFKYYFTKKVGDLDSEIFQEIKSQHENFKITRVNVKPESITIYPEELGVKVNIYLDSVDELIAEEMELDNGTKENKEYTLTIKLDSNLRVGYKRLNILSDYVVLFSGIKDIVRKHCFSGETEVKSFLICDIIRDINTVLDQKEIIDKTKNLKVSFFKQNIKITLRNSQYLMDNIRKYIGY